MAARSARLLGSRAVLAVAMTLLGLTGSLPAIAADSTPARYLVFATQADGSVRAVFSTRVQLRSPLQGRPYAGARAAGRDADEVRVRVEDARGSVVYEDVVEVPRWIRGEFHGNGPGALGEYAIDGHLLPQRTPAFVVRVPDIAGAALALESARLSHGARFDLDALDADPAVARPLPPPQLTALPSSSSGAPANRVDLLIMGDGYTAAEQAKFAADAQALADSFLSITPYLEYRNYVNVSSIFTASAQSGVDQPPYNASCSEYARAQSCCSDPAANGTTPKAVATAFGGTFCSFNIQRLATVDDAQVYAAAAAAPDWDKILVLVNSPTYGGSGGGFSVVSTHTAAVGVAQHEFGHSFMGLADEYTTAYPGYPACSDVAGGLPACEPNVTDQTSRPLIKWTRWIAAGQAVPSVDPPPVATAAGLWQGARYQATGMYRQGYACIMRNLGAPFCDVAAETYPLRLYQGGWGVPGAGIDNIEPGSESPAPGGVSAPYPGGSYSATVLGPQAGPNLAVEWYVDGALTSTQSVATGNSASHALVATPGAHTLELRVTDNSPIIHPNVRAGVASGRTWTVTVKKPDTSTVIDAHTPNPSPVGAPIAVTAHVTVTPPGAGTPTGNVTVSDGSANCVFTLPASSCNLTPTSTGPKSLTATYAGSANFSGSTSPGVSHAVVAAPLDVDASIVATKYDALTDGLLIVRYLSGVTGSALTTGAVGAAATRTDPAAIKAYLDAIRSELDIDGNGNANALTDGVLVVRYLFGLRGSSLIAGAIGPQATRATATAVEAYIQTLFP